ncbi:H(+)/Cl(-) exchange transporter ClcA [Striga asiatica]|uniref:H(+)/Cl(-) exchange transporter ClcA n=1 Tax=Striga asiatica TaxID=4170 RepID=A0A5A7R4U4_STRAF|nr:H(+)/Cl(-) exchange transporter ClcA [Striga asiatica]
MSPMSRRIIVRLLSSSSFAPPYHAVTPPPSAFPGHPNGTTAPLAAVRSSHGTVNEGHNRQCRQRQPAASLSLAKLGRCGAAITGLRSPNDKDNTPTIIPVILTAIVARLDADFRRPPPPPSSDAVLRRYLDGSDVENKNNRP